MPVRPKLKRNSLLLVTGLLLLIAAGRILRISLAHKELHIDEIWSIWQLLGNHTDYSRDATWPPLYYIALDGWRRLVGIDPLALRYLSVLVFMMGASCTYRLAQRLSRESAALIGLLAYSAAAMGIFLTTQMRAYGFVFALLPLAWWLTVRYFDKPGLRRAVMLAVVMVTMFYTAYGSLGAFLMLGIYTLLVYRQAIWRWWLPGIFGGPLAVPGILSIWSLAVGRVDTLTKFKLPDFLPGMVIFYSRLAGDSALPWALLVVIATIAIFVRPRSLSMKTTALLAWGLGPSLLYVTSRYLGLFDSIYGWFIVLGAALWIAVGLSYLPGLVRIGAVGILGALMLTPIPYPLYEGGLQYLGQSFQALAQNVQWGDVLVIDPSWKTEYCQCGSGVGLPSEAFDYLIRLYFPQGLQIVDKPQGYRRVWYLKWDSLQDHDFEKTVIDGRIPGKFVGPPNALFRLYEAPPDRVGILFDNGLRFHGLEIMDQNPGLLARRVLDTVRVRLWWTVDQPPSADYSIGLLVLNKGKLAIQSDSGPQLIDPALPKATSQWQPGQFYIEERTFSIPRTLVTAPYPIYLTVYQWWDQTRISAPGENQDKLLPIETLYVKGW